MKKSELTFAAVSVPVDYIMLVLAGLSAYTLRYATWVQNIRPVIFNLAYSEYVQIVFIVAFIWLVVFALQGLYTVSFHKRIIDELSSIIFACSTGLMVIIIYIFWQREFFDSRFIILAAWFLSIIYVSIMRIILRFIRRKLLIHGWGITRVVLIGADKATDDLASVFYRQPALGYRLVERFENFSAERISQLLVERTINEIMLADNNLSKEVRSEILNYCHSHHLVFQYVADVFEAQSHNVEIRSIGGMPLVEIKRTPLDGWGRIYKRAFDILASILLIIILIPFSLVVILFIKLDSVGPTIVKLKRIGKAGKPFWLYKYRSMIKDAHAYKYDKDGNLRPEFLRINTRSDGPLFKNEKDTRITRFGRILRRSSIDELPQLINVFFGEMSLVGPRPHEPEEVKRYEMNQHKLLSIKPGMTGLAQVSGRANLTFNEEVKLDLYYIENWSLKTDIQILFKTIGVVLKRKGVA
jgi:exopolysaccharide biosynthesis polyprenyl glycosylphosphotransferase